jgi:hypothetical protein
LIIGLAAVFGRNHGIYGLIGSLCVFLYLFFKSNDYNEFLKSLFFWGMGIIVGYMPLILMSLFISGFGKALLNSILFLFELKATNIPLPVPWPWLVSFHNQSIVNAIRGILIGVYFICIITFGIVGLICLGYRLYKKRDTSPLLVAAICLSLPYAHYAYSRADINHLAHGVYPFLIGAFAFFYTRKEKIKWIFAFLLSCSSVFIMSQYHPGVHYYKSKDKFTEIDISGSKLKIVKSVNNDIELVKMLIKNFAPENQSFIATPYWPGIYAIFNRKSPMWEIYAILPRSAVFEKEEIDRIKSVDPGFILIIDFPANGRDEMRFKNTHPLIYSYVVENYTPISGLTDKLSYHIFQRSIIKK